MSAAVWSGRGAGAALALPRTADGRPILSRAALEAYDPRGQRSGGRERYFCPIHGSDHQRSLSVDPETGSYLCHTCKAAGVLQDFWPASEPGRRPWRAPAASLEEIGRRARQGYARNDAARAGRPGGALLPPAAAAFLARLPDMQQLLRDPNSAGHTYLRGRGLDPLLAADLGAGYAPPNAWPGERGRRFGRIVYPLADPATGALIGALGRLSVDPAPGWSAAVRAAFKVAKQRKLAGCGAGVWPYRGLEQARAEAAPLIVVEGPADVLALLQHGGMPPHVIALCGTANILTRAALRGLIGAVLALDEDAAGSAGARQVRVELALAGLPSTCPAYGWLGTGDAADPADLAAHMAADPCAEGRYRQAMACVLRAYTELRRSLAPWGAAVADGLIATMYERCSLAYDAAPEPKPEFDAGMEAAVDAAYAARDLAALQAALCACEADFVARCCSVQDDTDGDSVRLIACCP